MSSIIYHKPHTLSGVNFTYFIINFFDFLMQDVLKPIVFMVFLHNLVVDAQVDTRKVKMEEKTIVKLAHDI